MVWNCLLKSSYQFFRIYFWNLYQEVAICERKCTMNNWLYSKRHETVPNVRIKLWTIAGGLELAKILFSTGLYFIPHENVSTFHQILPSCWSFQCIHFSLTTLLKCFNSFITPSQRPSKTMCQFENKFLLCLFRV